jgi:hypothetical protein
LESERNKDRYKGRKISVCHEDENEMQEVFMRCYDALRSRENFLTIDVHKG